MKRKNSRKAGVRTKKTILQRLQEDKWYLLFILPAIAYLIAPPLEGMYAMDAALKAADVKLCKLYTPPSETNFGGGLLSGTQSACQAACAAFAAAVSEVAATPRE
jgi:ethanolamine utilization microcompartment shell protein EutL